MTSVGKPQTLEEDVEDQSSEYVSNAEDETSTE